MAQTKKGNVGKYLGRIIEKINKYKKKWLSVGSKNCKIGKQLGKSKCLEKKN